MMKGSVPKKDSASQTTVTDIKDNCVPSSFFSLLLLSALRPSIINRAPAIVAANDEMDICHHAPSLYSNDGTTHNNIATPSPKRGIPMISYADMRLFVLDISELKVEP